jgi:predicted Zn-dependent peptidase
MNLKNILLFFLTLSLLLNGYSQVKKLEVQNPFSFSVYSLKNGLTVVLSKDNSLPLATVVCAYKVGSAYEEKGKTGLAHLLENLMFMGSRNVGPMQHIRFIHRIGGEFNALTSWDHTLFYQTIPSNQLPLVLWLESDRMNSLNLNYAHVEETKNLLIELARTQEKENPFWESSREFDRLLYPEFSYSHPIIGSEEDLKSITLKDAKNFYNTFYKPNNAVLCITGDIDQEKTLDLIKKYFNTIDPSKDVPSPPSFEGDFKQERHEKIIMNQKISTPGFRLGYRISSPYSNDFYILTMIDYILLHGESSRLHKRLMERNKLALTLSGGIEKRIDLAVFKFFVLSNNEATKEIAKRSLLSEINKLKTSLISNRELTKAKNIFKADFIDNYYSPEKRALFLTRNYISKIKIQDLARELDKYLSVSSSEIVGIMNRYFTDYSILLEIKSR